MSHDFKLNALHSFEMPKVGIYFLFQDDELVYIGRTKNGMNRMSQHLDCKKFDSYSFHKCSQKEAIELEVELIKRYQPKLNIQHNIRMDKFKQEFKIKFKSNLH